jgi:hypothetical protein
MTLVEQGRVVPLQPDRTFAIGHLRTGEYTLEVAANGGEPKRFAIVVPSADYDLEL